MCWTVRSLPSACTPDDGTREGRGLRHSELVTVTKRTKPPTSLKATEHFIPDVFGGFVGFHYAPLQMSVCQNANFDNQPFGKKTALVCIADFARDFPLEGRSTISRPAVDVKHTRRPCEISRAGVRVNSVDCTEQSRCKVQDTDVVSL